ncbi:MAG: 50S ribosomal protein L4 [Candidatus Omnitrophota bacterium]|nr:50S ribosomal protein L4 [Candidatus Omnitrophota bacterium]
MPNLAVLNNQGKEIEKLELPAAIFDGEVNKKLLHQAVIMYQANLRAGTASTKTRGEVSGGGKKPWRQKGTGRARAGSIRSPLWRHGGVVFGPHPRDFGNKLSQRIRLLALKSSLNDKVNSGNLKLIEEIRLDKPKTKEFSKLLSVLNIHEDTLAIVESQDKNFSQASRNIPFFISKPATDVNALDVLRHKNLLITKSGLKVLINRFKLKDGK